jgi:branched-subunit amino acid transport protein
MTPLWLAICLGLLAGTYLARGLPFWFPWIDTLPVAVKRFLDVVPAAALGALILPDALIGTSPVVAVPVVIVAFGLAMRGASITVVVLVTIALAWMGLGLLPV